MTKTARCNGQGIFCVLWNNGRLKSIGDISRFLKLRCRELCIYAGRLLVIDFYLWLCLHVGFPVALVSYSIAVCVPKNVNSIPEAIAKFQSNLLLLVCMLFHNRYRRMWE
ncbi:hypothetical protein IscW_ISCW018414 [Ixodes scapularis]|uniref:Uncharacterized protein n=1 Tax=Ixodes scapularis TaxID=6945 RepID=B7PHV7_IXOSC|nr:hypothetical protein IscW_ISCW018414 [Ixodes scapularis]|eukprot:XP_002403670.1 hypothetical protein IscW_ISCW018414 [Ixodes scapularis]